MSKVLGDDVLPKLIPIGDDEERQPIERVYVLQKSNCRVETRLVGTKMEIRLVHADGVDLTIDIDTGRKIGEHFPDSGTVKISGKGEYFNVNAEG